ncbi:hypothetical protein [Jiella sp. M17.18]|uniref:hypothetical protein n=1 Tax=Jiella sp. M17.18 TaxID=3234247 RepID=UPI0034DF298F
MEPDRAAGRTWDGRDLKVYDVVEWGWCEYRRRRTDSEHHWGVVVEISDERLVLWEHKTLAQAVKASWAGKVAAVRNEHALPVRRRLWEEKQALGPPPEPIEDDDLEVLGLLG